SQQVGHMLRGVPRGVSRCHQHFAKSKLIAISYFFWRKAVFSAAFATGVNLRGFDSRAELARTAHKIGVNMGLENMSDSEPRFTRHVHVNIYIGSRIEHCPHPFIVITE